MCSVTLDESVSLLLRACVPPPVKPRGRSDGPQKPEALTICEDHVKSPVRGRCDQSEDPSLLLL